MSTRTKDPARAVTTARAAMLLTGRPAILLVAVGIVVLTLFLPLRQWFAQRDQIAGLAAQTAAIKADLARLQSAQQRWSDPAYVAAQARSRLHFVMPGEVGYVVIGLPGATAGPDPAATVQNVAPSGAWYERLWASVQAVDSTKH